jgi:hypothetical protein
VQPRLPVNQSSRSEVEVSCLHSSSKIQLDFAILSRVDLTLSNELSAE